MREDQYAITVAIDGTPIGVWDKLTGGGVVAGDTKYKPGAMAPQISLGGSKAVDNITLSRLLSQQNGDTDLCKFLMQRAGKGQATINRQPLDADGAAFGTALVYTGTLSEVHPGDTDSNSTNANVWSIVISTDGEVG
jgi:hypothetical protein